MRAAYWLSYLVLLQVGFTLPPSVATGAVRSYRTISPLPALRTALRRCHFCGTFRQLALPRRYLAPCPMEPGLSSPRGTRGAVVWPTRGAVYHCSNQIEAKTFFYNPKWCMGPLSPPVAGQPLPETAPKKPVTAAPISKCKKNVIPVSGWHGRCKIRDTRSTLFRVSRKIP